MSWLNSPVPIFACMFLSALLYVLVARRLNRPSREAVVEMALCEASRVMLRPNQLYRFTVRPGCAACTKAAEPYQEDEETPAERYDREVYGDKWHTPMSL